MTTVAISPILADRIQPQLYGRNGMTAPAVADDELANAINQCAYLCGKELYTSGGDIANVPGSQPTTTTLYRGRFHTGPFCDRIRVYLTLARPDHGTTGTPRVTFDLQNTSGVSQGTLVAYLGFGSDLGTNTWATYTGELDVATMTDYQLVVTADDNGRCADVLVHEVTLAPDTANGYVPRTAGRILDTVRGAARLAAYNLYRRGGAVVASWSGNRSNATTTDTNIIDGSSTTVTGATPGLTLDMHYKARLRDASTGVNCKLYVYGSLSAGTGGSVKVKNSAGTALATLTGFTTTPAWQSTTLVLPATLAKYDLTCTGTITPATITITDVAIFEYES